MSETVSAAMLHSRDRAVPRATVDSETGAVYVYLTDGVPIDHTDELVPDAVMLDIAADGTVVGVEVLP